MEKCKLASTLNDRNTCLQVFLRFTLGWQIIHQGDIHGIYIFSVTHLRRLKYCLSWVSGETRMNYLRWSKRNLALPNKYLPNAPVTMLQAKEMRAGLFDVLTRCAHMRRLAERQEYSVVVKR